MKRFRDSLAALGGVGLLLSLTACHIPFARIGPKFDARAPSAGMVTNFTAVPLTNAVAPELLRPNA